MVKIRHSLGRFRCRLKPGFLSDHLSVYLESLEGRGYAALTMRGYYDAVCHFSYWAQKCHLTLEDLSDEVLTRFARHRCRCPGQRRQHSISLEYTRRVRRFVVHLRAEKLEPISKSKNAADSSNIAACYA